jgi:hypothetical protein
LSARSAFHTVVWGSTLSCGVPIAMSSLLH